MKKATVLIIQIALILLTFSCDYETGPGPQAELKIYVSGFFSEKPRKNVKVRLYGSEEDAQNETNELTNSRSDVDGFVVFTNLEINESYWARANTFLGINKTIRSITLGQIKNELELPVL